MKYHGKSSDCNDYDKYILNYGDHYEVLEEMETFHQQLNYGYDPKRDDICMDINEIIQVCSSYRPQYHEFFVHAAARESPELC